MSNAHQAVATPAAALACRRRAARIEADEPDLSDRPIGQRLHQPSQALDTDAAPALLWPTEPMLERWHAGGVVQQHRLRSVSWQSDGHWLYGTARVDERACGGLKSAAQRAYADLFDVLRSSPTPHLLRLWNYMADITGESEGLERYRQFNLGRQQAFIQAGLSAFDGAPAACALGTDGGPLTVHFLAARQAPIAVENPRQVRAYRYPSDYGPAAPTFSRAALASIGDSHRALFVSGTASIVGHATRHAGDVRLQVAESLKNVATLVDEANRLHRGDVPGFRLDQLDCTWYLRRPDDLPAVREVFERLVGAGSPAARRALYLRADICRPDLLVEIEGHDIIRSETL